MASGAAAKGQEDFPEVLTDVGFRGVQLVLARRLPSGLWNDLERVYSLLTPKVQEEPARLKKSKVMTGAILRNMDQASRQLNSYTFRNTVWPWRRGV